MPDFRAFHRRLRHALLGAALAFGPVLPAAAESLQVAQADCYAVGERVAAENGGQLARASSSNQGGRTVCVVVVLVPGRDGERPRRQEFVIPAD